MTTLILSAIFLVLGAAKTIQAVEGETDGLEGQALLGQIERRETALPDPPKYYFDTNASDTTVATLWMDLVDQWTNDSSLRNQHDNFYASALLYRANAQVALIHARRYVENGELENAASAIEDFDRSVTQFGYATQGAFASWDGNLERAHSVAEDVYRNSKAFALQLSYVLGPNATAIVDSLFTLTDANITYSESGASAVAEDIIVKLAVDAMFRYGKVGGLGDLSMADSIENGANTFVGQSGIYKIVSQLRTDPEVRVRLMRSIANSTSENIKALSKNQIVKLVNSVLDAGRTDSSESQIVGHFIGWVSYAAPAERVPGGVAVGDPVTIDIAYDTTPDSTSRHSDLGAVGYYFDTNDNENKIEVSIGNNTWTGEGGVGTGGVEILVFDRTSDGRPDSVRFATFETPESRVGNRWNAQFFLGNSVVPILDSDTDFPKSIDDFNFGGMADPECCFRGLMEGEAGQLGDSDHYYWAVGIRIDRSTFELGSTTP